MNDKASIQNSMPQQIDRYIIKSELGQGGMASVFLAFDPRFEREVAIKVLPTELTSDPMFRTRFRREARMIAALEHPVIVPVHDFGEQGEQPFLVMRLMRGGSLAERLEKDGALPLPEVARIVQRIGTALDEAHKQGVIHRDLKPGNILFDQYGHAYLSDFGIARSAQSTSTLTGVSTMGTPGYMSPEQIEGKRVDGRSDIYALGVLTYEMLTGKRPFDADTPAMAIVKQMTEPPPRLMDTRPELPLEYDTLLKRTMARDPEQRPGTAGEMASLLFAATRASRDQDPLPTAVTPTQIVSPPPPATTEKTPTPIEPPVSPLIPEFDTAYVEVIPCPHCSNPINIAEHGDSIHCPTCQNDFILAGHTCPNCYHYHDTATAVCHQCGQGINRACRHCHTPNWAGDEQCQNCGESLDIFELMYTHTKSATTDRLHKQMSEAQAFKKIEAEASEKRMAELQAIEAERQIKLQQRLQKKAQQEKRMLLFMFGLAAVLVIVILVFLLPNL